MKYGSLPFDEQIRFFRNKLSLPTLTWTDIWQSQHDHAFVVAGAYKAELLADLRKAIDKAIAEGTTLAEFRKDFDKTVNRHGWSYNGGRGWRTRVIYETNLRASYQAARYQQIQAVAADRPFLIYRHSDSVAHPRPQHVAWDGLVLRHDDPWFNTHYPPNGWGCRCRVFALKQRDLDSLGKTGPDKAPPLNLREVTVGKRGPSPRTVRVPEGIDPGWAYAPGSSAFGRQLAARAKQIEKYPQELAGISIRDMVGAILFARWYAAPVDSFPVARVKDTDAARIGSRTTVVELTSETARKQAEVHPDISPTDYQRVQDAVEQGVSVQDSEHALIYILDEPDGFVTVVKATRSGQSLLLQSLRRLSSVEAKRSTEIKRLRGKGK